MNTMTDPIPLSHLTLEGFGQTVNGAPTIDSLAAQLAARGIEIVTDDIGRRTISRADARTLFAERAQLAEAAQRRNEAWQRDMRAAALGIHGGLAARRERQLALRREHPELSAYAVAALDSGGADRELDAAGRRTQELLEASRRGLVGFGHRFTPRKG